MRLALVCHTDVSGGAERYLTTLSARLDALGHDVRLFGSVPGWQQTELPSTPVPLGAKWGGRTILPGISRLPRERRAIERAVSATSADVFHAQFKREQIGFTDVLARRGAVVWTEHGTPLPGRKGRALATAYRRAARNVAAILCVSDLVAENVSAIVGAGVRVEVVPNAVDTAELAPPTDQERRNARAALRLPGDDTRVLAWAGRLSPGKLPLLAAEVGRRYPGITVIAGNGALEDEVREAADGERVRFAGFQPDPRDLYRAADALLFTSDGRGEGLPYTLLEAAACGLPIVTNASSGVAAEVEAAGGSVARDDPQHLAAAAAELAAGGRFSQARTWACAHDLEQWTRRHVEVMESIAR
jgi:glycosyltransferase involved in cell wall biosynthesis